MTNGWNKQEQEFANERLAARQKANGPWEHKSGIGPRILDALEHMKKKANGLTEGVTMEQGLRDMVRCCLPWTDESHGTVHRVLRERLCEAAGGFTAHNHIGGWNDDQGRAMIEDGYTYEVSFQHGDNLTLQRLMEAFQWAGQQQGEQWTHIEYHKAAFEAKHTKTA